MKTRFGIAIAVAVLGFVAPASADTIANFTLDGVTFGDGGTATGSFTLDLDTSTLSNVNIITSLNTDSFGTIGTTYNDLGANTFTNGTTAQFEFDNFYYFFPIPFPTGEDSLVIDLPGPLTAANLAGSSSFAASGSESEYFFLCGGGLGGDFCGARTITAGTLDTGLSATPLPATLPLFAGGLGFVGYLTRRRKQSGKQALAAA
jgi:hypothetical protein